MRWFEAVRGKGGEGAGRRGGQLGDRRLNQGEAIVSELHAVFSKLFRA